MRRTRRRYAEHYAAFAALAGKGLRGPDEDTWTDQVEAELDNLRAVLAWSVAGGEADLALRLVAPLALVGTRIGYTTCAWAAPVVAMPEARAHRLYPEVLAWAGYAEAIAGDLEAGVRTCAAALDAAAGLGVDERAMCRVFASAAAVVAYRIRHRAMAPPLRAEGGGGPHDR